MVQIIAIGVGAGLAAALMFVSVVTGTFFAFPLFALSALPVGLAMLGWGSLSGSLAAAVGTGAVVVAVQAPTFAAGFALLIGGPAAWIALVAAQPAAAGAGPTGGPAAWHPLSDILLHAAGVVAFGLIVLGVVIHFDVGTITSEMLDELQTLLTAMPDATGVPARADMEPLVSIYVTVMPYTSAALVLTLLTLDTWLAARITAISGRLARPWTPLWTVRLPPVVIAIFVVVVLAGFLPGGLGLAFEVVAGATGFALALAGLATLHAVTLGRDNRTAILAVAYLLTFAIGLPLILWMILGIVDSLTGLRQRYAGGKQQ